MAPEKKIQSTIDWLVLLFWALMPLIFVSSIVDNTLLPRQIYASVAVIILGVLGWKNLFKTPSLSWGSILFLVFFGVSALSVLVAVNRIESFATLARYAVLLSYLLLLENLLREKKLQFQTLVKAIIVFGAIAALFTLFQLMQALGSGKILEDIYVIKASFSHKNLLSSALMLSLPFLFMGTTILEKRWKGVSIILLFLVLIEIFILRTRGVWLATLVGGAAAFAYFFWSKNNQLKIARGLVLGGVAVVLLVSGLLLSNKGVRENVFSSTNIESRIHLWENSVEMIKEHPLIGVGIGNWKIYFPKYSLDKMDISTRSGVVQIQRPHNDFLWVLSEAGPIALIGYVGAFVLALWLLIKATKKEESTAETTLINTALIFGIIAFLIFSFGDFPLERTEHGLLALSLLAMVFALNTKALSFKVPAITWKVVVLFLATTSLFMGFKRFQSEKNLSAVGQAFAARNGAAMIATATKVQSPYFNMDYFANPLSYYKSIGYYILKDYKNAHKEIEEALAIHPYSFLGNNQMGNVLKRLNKKDEALVYYNKALDISPTFMSSRLSKGEVLLSQGKVEEAFHALFKISVFEENPMYVNLMQKVLPAYVNMPGGKTKFKNQIKAANPQTPEDYYRAYKALFKP